MIARPVMYGSIAELADVVQHIQHTFWGGSFILKSPKNVGLGITGQQLDADHGGMSAGKPFPKLTKFYEAGAGVVLEIALSQLAQIGKLSIQVVQELEIATRLTHPMSFALAINKLQ